MTSVALRIASARPAAEDIVQNAFEKALRHFDQFDDRAQFSTWLHRIVVNEALMWLRSERRRSRHLAEVEDQAEIEWRVSPPDPAQHLFEHRRDVWVRNQVEALPADERQVLIRCALQEASYDEFCRETGMQPAAAKSRAFRARRRLRERLASPGR